MPALSTRHGKRLFRKSFVLFAILIAILVFPFIASTQQTENFDEARVKPYTLPPLLQTAEGAQIKTAEQWEKERRPFILQQFAAQVYGRFPGKPRQLHVKLLSNNNRALNGKATRKEIALFFTGKEDGPFLQLLLYLPNGVKQKVPVFVGLNFEGNHSIQADTGIAVTANWQKLHPKELVIERGKQAQRWPVDELIGAGYGLATAWYEDMEPDHAEGWKTGIRTTLKEELNIHPEEWGAIGAWAWGLSRIMDYLERDDRVNAKQVVITGHSRLGKAALWAAANDRRFAIVVSNNSGEGGAALARRNFGETVYRINTSFPHWFIGKYKTYNAAVDKLPVDQHMLLALMAPRPLYVASASEDAWADPRGEFLSAREAGKVYRLYNLKGIEEAEPPPVHKPVGNVVQYHIREGKHDMLLYDWQQYMAFADQFFRKK
jgi:hypothetical protein